MVWQNVKPVHSSWPLAQYPAHARFLRHNPRRLTSGIALLPVLGFVLVFALLGFLALWVGPYALSPHELLWALAGQGPSTTVQVVQDLRLPRVLAACCVGAALAGAGAVFQTVFRNPLVSPDILGVSTGATLGAMLGILLHWPLWGLQLAAFACGLATVGLVVWLAKQVRGQGHDPILSLVLLGLVLGAMAGALSTLTKVLADPHTELPAMVFWALGSLAGLGRTEVWHMALLVLPPTLVLYVLRWPLHALAFGDDQAQAQGLNPQALRFVAILAATLQTAAVVALVGVVGWLGLLVPHAARLWVGPALPRTLPLAMAMGAALLLAVDTLARAFTPFEIPLGVLTALLGAPCFVLLLKRRQHDH